MSQQLSTIALGGLGIGAKGAIDVSSVSINAAPVDPVRGPFCRLLFLNTSGVTLMVQPSLALQKQYAVPAAHYATMDLPQGESTVLWTAQAVFPYAYVPQCFVYAFQPYEPVNVLGEVAGSVAGMQSRDIQIPLTGTALSNRWSPPAAGAGNAQSMFVQSIATPVTVGQLITCYLYAFQASLSAGVAASSIEFDIQVAIQDHFSANVGGPVTIYRSARGALANEAQDPGPWQPSTISNIILGGWTGGGGGPYQIVFTLLPLIVTGAPVVVWTGIVGYDAVSTQTPGSIGTYTALSAMGGAL